MESPGNGDSDRGRVDSRHRNFSIFRRSADINCPGAGKLVPRNRQEPGFPGVEIALAPMRDRAPERNPYAFKTV